MGGFSICFSEHLTGHPNYFTMERISRKLHIRLENHKYTEDEVDKIWNFVSDSVSNILILKIALIIIMLVLFAIYLSITL